MGNQILFNDQTELKGTEVVEYYLEQTGDDALLLLKLPGNLQGQCRCGDCERTPKQAVCIMLCGLVSDLKDRDILPDDM